MTRWQTIQKLFDEAVTLDDDERARFLGARLDAPLDKRLGDREDLRREVEALVAADREACDLLDRGALDLVSEIAEEPDPEELCGVAVGDYRIETLLSSGGMAHVYRATLGRSGVTRRVAIKVLRDGLDTRVFLERFQRERQTLASLEHENIVSFLDGGALPDGRPFLAMELVDGEVITTWCREQGLDLRGRLALFLRVLSAVGHAHQRLVVHRDLKPSNILVTARGIPKLLDFGVASVLEQSDATTAAKAAPLTRAYASPEQLRGEAVSTASDVFALGALLYELLTDTPAFTDRRFAGESPALPGRADGSRALTGDLDAIIMTCLADDPSKRYASVDRLADDIERHLEGLPVAARTSTLRYRTGKFLRRHGWPVALGAALVLALVTGLVGAEVGRRRAEREASTGWGAHAQARGVASIYEDLLVEEAEEDAVARRRLIASLEAALASEIRADSESEALSRLMLARLYIADAAPDAARAQLERVLVLARTQRGLGRRDEVRAQEMLDALKAR